MAETRLTLEAEVQAILECIDTKRNFLLSGGAGCGKTYSLVQVIKQILLEQPLAKISCITYTNAAVKEIEQRVNHKNLNVSTIHDFLWDNIKHFQQELKLALVNLCNDENVAKIKIEGIGYISSNFFDNCENGIQYKEYQRLNMGIISHDQVLILAEYMFANYPRLCSILKDRCNYILVDEYQDTSELVVKILLDHLRIGEKHSIIGFLGDSMQSIYADGVGNINDYVGEEQYKVKEIIKCQNRRCPHKVIELANKLRTDHVQQQPSNDPKAPNMVDGVVKDGKILFLYSTIKSVEFVKQYLTENYQWDFTNAQNTKELNLTHNLIADEAGFRVLMDIYDKDGILEYKKRISEYIKKNNINIDFSEKTFGQVIDCLTFGKSGKDLKSVLPTQGQQHFLDNNQALFEYAKSLNYKFLAELYVSKDQLLDDKKQDEEEEKRKGSQRDDLIKHLMKIQDIIYLYKNQKYNEFLRKTDYRTKLLRIEDKKQLKTYMDLLQNVGDKTIDEIICLADEKEICLIDDHVVQFKEKKKYLYHRIKDVPFVEFQKLYDYLEGKTPFSTQHKTKGSEYDDVLVIMNNANWNQYKFESVFTGIASTSSVLERSQKLFYVCCTRAKESLVIYFNQANPQVIERAVDWFGTDNVIDLDNL